MNFLEYNVDWNISLLAQTILLINMSYHYYNEYTRINISTLYMLALA